MSDEQSRIWIAAAVVAGIFVMVNSASNTRQVLGGRQELIGKCVEILDGSGKAGFVDSIVSREAKISLSDGGVVLTGDFVECDNGRVWTGLIPRNADFN